MTAPRLYGRAVISRCGAYRYYLDRDFENGNGKTVLFVLNNPSTADALESDPTLNRGIGYAREWGFSKLVFLNTNPYRATEPSDCRVPPERVLLLNDAQLRVEGAKAAMIICAWGNHALYRLANRAERILSEVTPVLYAMKVTKLHMPYHILYLPGDLTPQVWKRQGKAIK